MLKLRENTFDKIYYYLIFLLTFFLPVKNYIVTYLVVLLVLTWILQGNFKEKFKNIFRNKYSLLFIAYFLIYVIGLIYSKNFVFGIFDIEIKLSLLIFPLIFSSFSSSFFEKIDYSKLLHVFVLGCLTASVICLGHAYYEYSVNGDVNIFYYKDLSILYHPSYFAMYLDFAIAISLFYLLNNETKSSGIAKYKYYIIILSLTVIVVLLSSKAGIITLGLAFLFNIIYLILIRKKYLQSILVLLIISVFLALLLQIFPFLIKRTAQSEEVLTNKSYLYSKSNDGTSSRILIWKISLELIKDSPLTGYGTGDVKDILMEKYKENNMTIAYDNKLNAHNQYFQTWIATGFSGFLILALSLILPIIPAFRQRNYFYVFFLLIIIFNISVESMFEVQGGVVFYAFFNSLLLLKPKSAIPEIID